MTVVQQVSGKERTRGPNLAVFVARRFGVPMEEALVRANEAGVVIASNKRLGQARIGGELETIKEALACWSGTMTGYVEPDRTFREAAEKISSLGNGYFIVYVDPKTKKRYLFPVPEEHLDKKNAILVAEHPDYTLETDGNNRIVRVAQVDLIERFPALDGWYPGDSKHDISIGEGASDHRSPTRLLWRIDKRVGLVACFYQHTVLGRGVVLDEGPSSGYGVAVEVPAPPVPSVLIR